MEKWIHAIFLVPSALGFSCFLMGLVLIYVIYKETSLLRRTWIILGLLIIGFIAGYIAFLVTLPDDIISTHAMSTALLYCLWGIFVFFSIFTFLKTLRIINAMHTLALQNKTLTYSVTHDYLTRLKNKATFINELIKVQNTIKRGSPPSSLLYIDIDNFKQFNVDYGYPCGDYLLTKVADIFIKRARKTDVIGRYDDDAFVIVLYNTNVEQAQHFARMLVIKLAGTELTYKHHSFTISCSIGVTAIESTSPEGEALVEIAKRAHALNRHMGNGQVSTLLS